MARRQHRGTVARKICHGACARVECCGVNPGILVAKLFYLFISLVLALGQRDIIVVNNKDVFPSGNTLYLKIV